MAGSTEALGGTCQGFLNSQVSRLSLGPDRFCTALSPTVHSAGKEQSSVPGWVPACGGKDQWVLLAHKVDVCSFH